MLAVALWGFVSWAFSTYLANFGNYDKVYGSLGAVIALLMWFYLSAFMVLLGAIFVFLVGLVDDKYGIGPLAKLIGQIVACAFDVPRCVLELRQGDPARAEHIGPDPQEFRARLVEA